MASLRCILPPRPPRWSARPCRSSGASEASCGNIEGVGAFLLRFLLSFYSAKGGKPQLWWVSTKKRKRHTQLHGSLRHESVLFLRRHFVAG